MNSILDQRQKNFLKLFGQEKQLSSQFYLSGGTALTAFYLPYRFSEDLDFLSDKEIKIDEITVFIRSIKDKIGYQNFEYNSSFNRHLFFLKFSDSSLKLEFTYYPFAQIYQPTLRQGIKVDSPEDIACNKLFTIYQRPRARDFIDLYLLCQKYQYSINKLIVKAKIKFDTHIDPIKLGSQFLLAEKLKDYPRLIKPTDHQKWQKFFRNEAKKLKSQIIE